MPNHPSAPAPRSSPSEWREDPNVVALREQFEARIGDWVDRDTQRDLTTAHLTYEQWIEAFGNAVASCGERGGGLEAAAQVCEQYAQECGRNVRLTENEGGFERTLWANHGVAAQECAKRIRALSSSPPSVITSSPSTE